MDGIPAHAVREMSVLRKFKWRGLKWRCDCGSCAVREDGGTKDHVNIGDCSQSCVRETLVPAHASGRMPRHPNVVRLLDVDVGRNEAWHAPTSLMWMRMNTSLSLQDLLLMRCILTRTFTWSSSFIRLTFTRCSRCGSRVPGATRAQGTCKGICHDSLYWSL